MSTIVAGRAPSSITPTASAGRRKLRNRIATVLISSSFLIALVPLVWLLYTVISKGFSTITHAEWWTGTQRNISFKDPGGGAYHAIIGTLEQVALCALISVPIGILVGVYLVEYGRGLLTRMTSFMVDILTGLPSVVAALFIFAMFVTTFKGHRAGFLVSLALVMLMLPVIVRTTEEMLKLVPNELREASYALGVRKWKTILKVVIPTAFSGLITGVVLGIARVAGETAPLLILVGYSGNLNTNLFNGFQGSLPGMINDQFPNLTSGGHTYGLDANGHRVLVHNYAPDRLWGTALTLIIIVMALNLIARFIGRFNKVAQ